jgi:tape measure domain-containing protein
MHRNAIISLADAWSGPIKAFSKYQSQIAMMTSFVGEGPAKKFIDDLRQSQVGRLYGDEASVAATRFLPLTKDAGKTKKILDQVGNIASGDAERFQGISRALSQVMAQGYLQGDELEQFAERGFPMTELLAKNLKISTAEVRKLGEQRRLSSSLILAVMEKETSAGGDYAGTMGRMSEKLGGVISSVMSLYTELQTKVMEAAEKEMTSYVQVLAGYLKQIVEWVRINQEQVRGYVLLAIKITAAVAAFHLLGLAVAYARWMMRSFMVVLIALMAVFRGLRVLVVGTIQILAVLRGTLALTQVGFVATWIAALGPVGAVVAAISLVVGVVSALIISLTSPGGLAGAFKYAFGVASDFFMWIAKQFGFDMEKGFLEAMGLGLDPKFLKDAKVEIPEAPDTDFSSLIGPGKEKGSGARGSNEYKLFDSLSKHSGEYKERRWQQQMTLARWEQGAAAPQDKQDRMIKALDGIEKNTRPAGWQKQLQWIEPANLAGVP